MTSQIDPLQPPQGYATTAQVRANFAAAKNEIEALQLQADQPKTTVLPADPPPASVTLSAAGVDLIAFTATANTTINLSGGVEGQAIILRITQDATGGRLVAFGASIRAGLDLPTWTASTGGGTTDYAVFRYDATAEKFDLLAFNSGFIS